MEYLNKIASKSVADPIGSSSAFALLIVIILLLTYMIMVCKSECADQPSIWFLSTAFILTCYSYVYVVSQVYYN